MSMRVTAGQFRHPPWCRTLALSFVVEHVEHVPTPRLVRQVLGQMISDHVRRGRCEIDLIHAWRLKPQPDKDAADPKGQGARHPRDPYD